MENPGQFCVEINSLAAIRTAELRLARRQGLTWAMLLREDWTVRDDFLTIDLLPFMKGASERLGDLAAARKMVTSSPGILGGTPIIRSTRVPVYDVAASVAAGQPSKRILATWPSLDAEQVRLATIFAEANPLRGRPRASADLPEARSSSRIAAFLGSGRRDEVSVRRVPKSGIGEAGTGKGHGQLSHVV